MEQVPLLRRRDLPRLAPSLGHRSTTAPTRRPAGRASTARRCAPNRSAETRLTRCGPATKSRQHRHDHHGAIPDNGKIGNHHLDSRDTYVSRRSRANQDRRHLRQPGREAVTLVESACAADEAEAEGTDAGREACRPWPTRQCPPRPLRRDRTTGLLADHRYVLGGVNCASKACFRATFRRNCRRPAELDRPAGDAELVRRRPTNCPTTWTSGTTAGGDVLAGPTMISGKTLSSRVEPMNRLSSVQIGLVRLLDIVDFVDWLQKLAATRSPSPPSGARRVRLERRRIRGVVRVDRTGAELGRRPPAGTAQRQDRGAGLLTGQSSTSIRQRQTSMGWPPQSRKCNWPPRDSAPETSATTVPRTCPVASPAPVRRPRCAKAIAKRQFDYHHRHTSIPPGTVPRRAEQHTPARARASATAPCTFAAWPPTTAAKPKHSTTVADSDRGDDHRVRQLLPG